MANANGKNYTKFVAGGKFDKGEYNGHVKTLYEEYTFPAAAFASGDTISCGKLPPGARVRAARVKAPSLGTTGIFDLGYAASEDGSIVADPDGFVLAADAGGQVVQAEGSGAGIGKKFDKEVLVQLKSTEVTTAAAGLLIQAWVSYIVD